MKRLAIAAAFACAAGTANAATLSYDTFTAVSSGNWTDSLTLSQFDSALGTLTSVMVTMTGGVAGLAEVESEDTTDAGTVTYALEASLSAALAGAPLSLSVIPQALATFEASVFDGDRDYGGTSGFTNETLSDVDVESATYTLPADLAYFTGTGDLTFNLNTIARSFASGPGDMASRFSTDSAALMEVVYTYDAATVPLPAGLPLLLAGLGGLALVRRRKS